MALNNPTVVAVAAAAVVVVFLEFLSIGGWIIGNGISNEFCWCVKKEGDG